MQIYSPIENMPRHVWEGDLYPPLHMAQDADAPAIQSSLPAADPVLARVAAPRIKAAPDTRDLGNKFLRQIILLIMFGVLCVGAYYVISRYVVTPVVIQGRSMTPTLRDGECYFLNRWIYLFQAPARGDLVVIKDPGHDDFAVKRLIAMPGDWLNLKDGKVYLNGARLQESYLPRGTYTTTADSQEKWYQLGNQQFFVMGDNRACSEDSRVYGHIVRGNILGVIRN